MLSAPVTNVMQIECAPTTTTNIPLDPSSTFSCSVPETQHKQIVRAVQKPPCSIQNTLNTRGYKLIKPISDALQGTVMSISKNTTVFVAKIVNKSLHHERIVYKNNKPIRVKEDILKESSILQYLTNHHPPLSLAKFVEFFEDEHNYFLIMEHGGDSLFSFVQKCHGYIVNGSLPISAWRSFCIVAMRKIVSLIDWMHNIMNCCHLDISLENFVISDVNITLDATTTKILYFHDDFEIKIIDFGLAEVFAENQYGNIDFRCNKYVGKIGYKAPEVLGMEDIFDARSADCWSVMVCCFMMIIGSPPFVKASTDDQLFNAITHGKLVPLLRSWNRMQYVDTMFVDLINKMFVTENEYDRLNIKEIQKHPFLL